MMVLCLMEKVRVKKEIEGVKTYMSMATVIGPTPPGTRVIHEAMP